MKSIKLLIEKLKKQIINEDDYYDLWSDCTGNYDDSRDNGMKLAESSMSKEILPILEYFVTTHNGLWVTDRPDILTEEQKKVFWELK